MSVVVSNRDIKRTWKTKILLGLDTFFRSLYPLRLNRWIFDHLDHFTEKETQALKEEFIRKLKARKEYTIKAY